MFTPRDIIMATEKAVTYAKKLILSNDITPFQWWKY